MTTGPLDDQQCHAAALAGLDMGPARLRRLLAGTTPRAAWEALATGSHPADPEGRGVQLVRPGMVEEAAERCRAAGVDVVVLGSPAYPPCLAGDDDPPAVLFVRGRLTVLDDGPRVAVVGTRSATEAGLETARAIGSAVALAGATVVSGLATGIDSSALDGSLESGGPAGPVAVLGTAHDGSAQPAQRRLQEAIAEAGLVLSEQAPGSRGARWRFAVRNRIMAALAQLVVVVECHVEGGALHTVRAAERRGVPVAAVPGAVGRAASAGTNELLVGGAHCVRDGTDVVALLARLTGARLVPPDRPDAAAPRRRTAERRPGAGLDPVAVRVLQSLDAEPLDLSCIVERTGEPLGAVAVALEQLADQGLARGRAGWWRRVAAGWPPG